MNNIKKCLKIMLIIYIILTCSIMLSSLIYAVTGNEIITDSSNTVDTGETENSTTDTDVEDITLITSSVYTGEGEDPGLVDLTGDTFVITFNELQGTNGNTWYLMCNEHGVRFMEVETLYTITSTNEADPEEAYILSGLKEYNEKGYYRSSEGQWAWWNRGQYVSALSSDTLYLENLNMSFDAEGLNIISKLISSGILEDLEEEEDIEYVKEILEEIILNYGSEYPTDENIDELLYIIIDIYESSSIGIVSGSGLTEEAVAFKDYIVRNRVSDTMVSYTVDGITVSAYELEMEATLYAEDATVAFSEEDNAYIVGPFRLSYPEAGFIRDDGTYVMLAGLNPDYLVLETNLGEMTYYNQYNGEEGDWTISYTNESMIDVNGLPKSVSTAGVSGEFYIILNYKVGMTKITKLKFTYQYMNAGGVWKNYSGQMKYCSVTDTYYNYDQECTFSGYTYYCDEEDCPGHIRYTCNICRKSSLTQIDITTHNCLTVLHSQNMTVIDKAVRWYTELEIEWDGESFNKGSLTIIKNVTDENGNIVDVNDTFFFDIYVDYHDGEGEKLLETIAVSTRKGTGSRTTTTVWWGENSEAPTYRVVEQNSDGYTIENKEFTGSMSTNETIEIVYNNYVNPDKGKIEIDKQLLNATDALKNETFEFTVQVWGEFKYNGGELTTYSAAEPLEITAYITGSGKWVSELFEWYGDAPQYRISETVSDTSDFELVSTNNKTGTMTSNEDTVENEDIINSVEIFVNQPRDKSQIIINKELVDGLTPDSEDIFTVAVTITGDFIYKDSDGEETRYTSDRDGLSIEVELTESNEWSWESGTIYWTTTIAPTYIIEETGMPDDYVLSRIESESGSLNTEKNIIYIYNEKVIPNEGYLQIEKILETDVEDLENDRFSYEIEVTGNFTYDGDCDSIETLEDGSTKVTITDTISVNQTNSYGPFYWAEEESAPTYTVTETGLEERDDVSFVSISNSDGGIVTNTPSISGSLADNDTVIVTMRNRGIDAVDTQIQIIKNVIGNTDYLKTLDESERVFTFQVELTGTFTYTYEDETEVTIENDTLTIDGIEIDVLDTNKWMSGTIEWDNNLYTAPTYRITEVDIPEWAEFICWHGRTNMSSTTFINGTLTEDTINIFICSNEITVTPQYGRIQIEKELLSDLISSDENFNFTVTVSGEFTYTDEEENTTSYPNDNNESLELTVSVSADSSWTSGEFYWETDEAPTYIITENLTDEQIEVGIEVEGFINSSQSTTTKTITGSLIGSENKDELTIAKVIAKNNQEIKIKKGRIQITKEYVDANGNEIDGAYFTFNITITYADGTAIVESVAIPSGTTWRSDYYYWSSIEEAPTYEIVETSTGNYTSEIIYPESEDSVHRLEEDTIIKINVINTVSTPKQGQISITKYLIDTDKVSIMDYQGSFTFIVTIKGTFTYTTDNGTISVVDDTLTLNVTINIDATDSGIWTSGRFEWYGDEAPTYSVEETNISTGWWLYEMENSSGSLVEGETAEVTVTNQTGEFVEIDITMQMGGKVWDDTDYSVGKEADTGENGIIDDSEAGIEGIKVTITRLVTDSNGNVIARLETIYVYDENDHLTLLDDNYTYTDLNGNWSFGSISVPAFNLEDETENLYYELGYDIAYDVTFSYDGQTYEPTTYLVTSGGDASAYKNASTSERDNWLKDSMVVDDTATRQEFNAKFENIEGQDPIQSDGTTVGKATSENYDDITLNYTSTNAVSTVNSDNTRKVSTLQTYDENDEIYEDFLIDASTSTNGLTYPFDNEYHLESWDKIVDPLTGLTKTTYHFSATYNYVLSINLGLIKRESADIALEKDLTEAIVVINGKVLKYKFNSAIDLESEEYIDLLYKQIAVADEEIEYTLGLYSSDYYYRASIYDNTEVSEALVNFYTKTLNFPSVAKATELQIYLKYTINVYNESNTYDVSINQIADYYDETFELITDASDSATYIQTLNGEEVNEVVNLAETSTVTYYSASNEAYDDPKEVIWSDVTDTVTGSDGVTYNKITTESLKGTLLSSGQRAEIQLTFKVNKSISTDEYKLEDSIILGEKHNVAEVTSFSTYYSRDGKWSSEGEIAGRVDEDSAPGNVNIQEYNEKLWYEDDTESAPILVVELYDEDREVNGLVWEDAQTDTIQYSQTIGDGIYNPDQGDKTIADLTTEIIEVISIPTDETDDEGNTVYKEYEFIWPTEETILNGYSLEEVTGFDSTIVTNSEGVYAFTAVPAGNYKVRFVYGDKEIETGNEGYEEVYNGQDYKSTSYQIGFNNDSESDDETADGYGYVDNEWHDLSNSDLEAIRVSDARDVEARRLIVASYSEILQYDNTSVLATADDIDADHTELFGTTEDDEGNEISGYEYAKTQDSGPIYGEGYYMYAETAKINIEVENVYDINYGTETIGTLNNVFFVDGNISKGAVTTGNEFEYFIDNIDFGIEERSQTKLTLDKQIKQLTLTTSDGNVILDAVYDIEYELGDDDTIKSSVTLNNSLSTGYSNLASLNRTSTSQGYRYIMAESTILQGATITIQYQLMVFNVGEADTCNEILEDLWDTINTAGYSGDDLDKAVEQLSSPYYTVKNGRVNVNNYNSKYQYGTYFGSIYYLGTQGTYSEDTILVESTVHQIIDYVDPDVEFVDYDNISVDQSWSSVSIDDLIGYVEDELLDPAIIQIVNDETGEPVSIDEDGNIVTDYDGRTIYELTYYNISTMDGITEDTYNTITSGLTGDSPTYRYTVINNNLQEYVTDSKNNIILSIDNSSDSADAGTNPSLVKATVPYTAENDMESSTAEINLTVSRYYSSETDASDIDNIAEIIKVENTVGRRDVRSIIGNTSTYELEEGADGNDKTIDIYTISLEEPDTSSTEIITLSPPTGLSPTVILILQIVGTVAVAGTIIAVGIIVIKKKVLLKK